MKLIKNIEFPELELKDIRCVYEGKPGCMCGCLGEYYVPTINKEYADKKRGYVLDNANDAKVLGVLEYMKKNSHGIEITQGMENDILILDKYGGRWAIYLMGRIEIESID